MQLHQRLPAQRGAPCASTSTPAPQPLRATSTSARQVRTHAALHTAGTETLGLSKAQVEEFRTKGYLAIPGAATEQQCAALKARMGELLKSFDPDAVRSIFSTKNQTSLTDAYFLDSASNVSFFFEEAAFDADGRLKQSKELSINKVGHALHDVDPVFRSFARSPTVLSILRSLGYRRPLPVQSMYIFKQPHIGGEVVPHQDSSFLITEPLSCVGLWWALEDATKDNGCLWALPGVHKEGLKRRFVRSPEGKVSFDAPQPAWDLSKFEPVECPAGTLVLLHGENVHYSCENTSPVSRHSFSMHVVESAPCYAWPSSNWAHRSPDNPWEPLYEEHGTAR